MNTRNLQRQRTTKPVKRDDRPHLLSTKQDLRNPKTHTIEATAHTGEPARSFRMSFQYEEAARFRSQDLREQAARDRLVREARAAQRVRRQTESSARRARRTLAGLLLAR